MDRKQVLLDTDIGTDIDDAVCLAYLLAQPECDLLGITTATGEADKRAMMASAMCEAAGRDIPVLPGSEAPIIVEQKQTVARQASALGRWRHKQDFPQGEAVEFLRKTIRSNPGRITLLTIGPLTNVGLLFRVDPEIPSLLKKLVIMAGVFFRGPGVKEWNACCDPHAAAVVYNSGVKAHRSIGLDVTRQVWMAADEARRRFTCPLLEPVMDFAEVWFEERDRIVFHDPLAAAVIFDDDLCSFRRGDVEVELLSGRMAGATYFDRDGGGAHEVAFEVDGESFFEHFFSVLS